MTYYTWDGKEEIKVVWTNTGPSRTYRRGDWKTPEANVKRIIKPSDELYDAIFNQENGTFCYKNAKEMTLHQRTTWLHLWDGVCCGTISHMEAWDCITQGFVSYNLLVRASNYMHLL